MRAVGLACALAIFSLLSCTEQDVSPVSPGGPNRVQLAIQPRFANLGGAMGAPINRIRATAREAATNQILGTLSIEVDPNAAEWRIPLEVQLPSSGATNVVVTLELLHVEGTLETVEWSGVVTVAVSPGQNQPAAAVELFQGPPSNLSITSVRIGNLVSQFLEGGSIQLTAAAEGASAPPQIFWSSLDPTIATVSATGLVQGILPGRARIVATAGPRADTATITIVQRIASVQLTPNATTLTSIGSVGAFQARLLDPRGAQVTGDVTWSVADPGIAESLGNGQFRARANGTTTVTATSVAQPTIRATASLVVAQRGSSIELTPQDRTLTSIGTRQQFTAVARDAGGAPLPGARFTWSSSDATVATIDANGLATSTGPGTTTISVSTPSGSPGETVTASTSLRVSRTVALVEVLPADDTLFALGESHTLTARAFDGGGGVLSNRTFTWSSSNPGVVSVDAGGRITAVSAGVAIVRAETDGVSGSATVYVTQTLTRVDVVPRNASASAINQRVQFNAITRDRANNPLPGRVPVWSSSNPAVATITQSGLATAMGFGTATIRATIDGVTGTAEFTVQTGGRSVTVTPASVLLLNRDDNVQLTAAVRNAAGALEANQAVTWTTFDASVAGVTPAGLVTARNPGTVTIMATSGDASGTAVITVGSNAPVARVTVTPNAALVPVGGNLGLNASAFDVQGNLIPGAAFTWSTSNAAVATVSASGLVNGIAVGEVMITATSGGRSGTSTIKVYTATAAAINKASGDLQTGTVSTPLPDPLVVRVTDTFGNPVSGQVVQWVVTSGAGTANPVSATSNADGFAQTQFTLGPTAGTQTIEARVTGLTGSPVVFTATAVAAAVNTVTVAPPARTMIAGEVAALTATARDASNNVIPGVVFAWSSSDTTVAIVDGAGNVTARLAGTATITATANGKTGSSTITVNAGAPAVLSGWSGNGQSGVVLTVLAQPLIVRVTDIAGNPVAGVTVAWVITSGGGSTTPITSLSGADGLASTNWTLGPTVGNQTVEARATGLLGSPYVFTASASDGIGIRRTWIGGAICAPTDWSTAENWMPAGVPIDRDTAVIPASAPNQPAINQNVVVARLIVETGATLNTSGYMIQSLGNVDASGAITGPGSLLMTGTNALVRGQVSSITIQGTVTANGSLTTTGSLAIDGGNLTVNGQTIGVLGDFTAGGGTITMTNPSDVLVVAGNTSFYAINETGLLTAGAIFAAGNFGVGCYNDTEFVSTGTNVFMNGAAPQTVSMACSGALRSRFMNLFVANGATVNFSDNPVYVAAVLNVAGTVNILAGAVVDVAGPPNSVVINPSGVVNINPGGVLKANLPVTNNGTLNGTPTQR